MADLERSRELAAQGRHAEAAMEALAVARQAVKDMEAALNPRSE
ncbi:hypothetical protein ABZW11_17370 [Nonomuraea sp. NPDC004580]